MNATNVLPRPGIARGLLRTAVGRVECQLTGGDGPVVLASHAGLGGVDQARVLLNWIDPGSYRLLSVSRPGYLGTPLESGRSFAQQADLFAALLDTLGVEKAAVVTLSAGGPAGYLFAIRHPDRIRALIAIDSASGRHEVPETAGALAQTLFMSEWGQKLTRLVLRKRPEWFLRQMLRGTAYFTKRQLDEHVDHALASPRARSFIASFTATMFPYRPRRAGTENDTEQLRCLAPLPLEQVRCPTLIVHGTHDADVKFHHGVFAHEHTPHAERYWIDEGDHLGFWLSPRAEEAQDIARDFLRRHCGVARHGPAARVSP
ncbi:MAG TPA: alpha/beta hydrolase [Gemmatimonadaceae bacterium]